ncbi:MAG: hypothetical protein RLP44_01225 [Aggregatilineales bacterium]
MSRSNNWMEHALKRTGWRPERQVVALAALGFAIALILGALYLSQVALEATTNRRLRSLLEQRDELERVNEDLRGQIAELESVPALRSRAQALGFQDAGRGSIEYLPVDGYRPPRIEIVTEDDGLIDVPPESEYDESFTDWFGREWSRLLESINNVVGGDG